jgi:hypothetical protein
LLYQLSYRVENLTYERHASNARFVQASRRGQSVANVWRRSCEHHRDARKVRNNRRGSKGSAKNANAGADKPTSTERL